MNEGKNSHKKSLSLLYSQIDVSKSEKYVTLKLREIHIKNNMQPSTTVRVCVCVCFFSTTGTGALIPTLTQTQGGGPPG